MTSLREQELMHHIIDIIFESNKYKVSDKGPKAGEGSSVGIWVTACVSLPEFPYLEIGPYKVLRGTEACDWMRGHRCDKNGPITGKQAFFTTI